MALTTKGHFKINDEEFKAKSLNVGYESILSEDSGRTDSGKLKIDFIVNRARNIEITLPPASGEDVRKVLSLVTGNKYNITFYDALENQEITLVCYTPNTSASLYSGVILNGLWQDVSFTAIELGGELIEKSY